jgi:hypothetical protein
MLLQRVRKREMRGESARNGEEKLKACRELKPLSLPECQLRLLRLFQSMHSSDRKRKSGRIVLSRRLQYQRLPLSMLAESHHRN